MSEHKNKPISENGVVDTSNWSALLKADSEKRKKSHGRNIVKFLANPKQGYCANCGNECWGQFCSTSCEREIFGG